MQKRVQTDILAFLHYYDTICFDNSILGLNLIRRRITLVRLQAYRVSKHPEKAAAVTSEMFSVFHIQLQVWVCVRAYVKRERGAYVIERCSSTELRCLDRFLRCVRTSLHLQPTSTWDWEIHVLYAWDKDFTPANKNKLWGFTWPHHDLMTRHAV